MSFFRRNQANDCTEVSQVIKNQSYQLECRVCYIGNNFTLVWNSNASSHWGNIFKLFEYSDIVVFGERDYRDTTQYGLILDL